ncbi:MAG: ABC transporter ATP-binding protein [Gammaproteobacteria bacterium]|nr:ABC transporter ATP-binding protein [Gammaproteobacteria bacterium]
MSSSRVNKIHHTEQAIVVQNLRFSRGERLILDGVDIQVPRGKITAIMGPSGTGKTTLLGLIGGQLQPDSGTVSVENHIVSTLSRTELYRLRQRMGMLFQSGALFSDLSVYDNVAFPLREHADFSAAMIHDLVMMKLHAVGLRGACNLMPNELSAGMARRVALARAIALDPMLIMYDEPFTGQDPITVSVIMRLIRRLNDSLGLTSIVISHDVPEVCAIADQIYLLSSGQVVASGSPDELHRSESPWVVQFLSAQPDGPIPFHFPAKDFIDDMAESP